MNSWLAILSKFLLQTQKSDLKTYYYPKQWGDLRMRVSFGMGAPARVPWIAFVVPEMAVSKGFYPVYLYYKELETLILAYGVSETEEFGTSWPPEIMNSIPTITAYFDRDVSRYGNSFVFKAYKIRFIDGGVQYLSTENETAVTEKDIEADLVTLLDYYKKVTSVVPSSIIPEMGQGLFYMEKQLEDFLILNWEKTELGKKYDLIIEDGELISQQFRTDIGPIDILAIEKSSKSYVVIELKKSQTSDDTVGQLTRYGVKGIIIAGQNDKRLEYALTMVPNTEVFLYEVSFKLIKPGNELDTIN